MDRKSVLSSSIWITWERQTRNRSASEYLGVPLVEIIYSHDPALVRYFKSVVSTLKIIIRRRPQYVFAQNPSVVLASLAVMCSKIFRFTLIIDAHNAGINYDGKYNTIINFLNGIIVKSSAFTIVTNEDIAELVTEQGGTPLILPDPLPSLPENCSLSFDISPIASIDKRLTALCITSWGDDEPIEALIAATKKYAGSIQFFFTGNWRKAKFNISHKALPTNVHLMGFVEEHVYFSLLAECDFTIDLTTRQDCLVCGAYESVAAGKPMVLSDTKPQRDYFNKGAVFSKTSVSGIQEGIAEMLDGIQKYSEGVSILKHEILEREELRLQDFVSSITEKEN